MAVLTHFFWLACVFSHEVLTERPKTAAVFGGGAAGLTAAMELRQAGFNVNIYEKEEDFGGKMRGYVDKNGFPIETTIRVYHFKYFALGDIFSRAGLDVPTVYGTDSSHFKRVKFCLGSNTGYVRVSKDTVPVIKLEMLKLGFMPAEYKYMGYQVAAWGQMSASAQNSFYDVPFKDFFDSGFAFNFWKDATNCTEGTVTETVYCVPEHSPAFYKFMTVMLGAIVLVKPEDSTAGWMYALHLIFSEKLVPTTPQCEDYYHFFKGGYFARGPTSFTLIKPWEKHLKNIGVKLHPKNNLLKLNIDPLTNSVKSAVVKTLKSRKKKEVKADVYIIALPVDDAEDILPGITQGRFNSVTWSAGIMFYLPCLPQSFEIFRNRSISGESWDAEYQITIMFQSPTDGLWEGSNFRLHKGIEYTMSTLVGNLLIPGRNGKSFLNNTWEDALSEILQQVYFPEIVTCQRGNKQYTYDHAHLIRTAKAGLLIEDVSDARYQKMKTGKYRTARVGPLKSDGKRWILSAPVYMPSPTFKPISPCTDHHNLALAGEYVASPLVNIASMEHAAETGKIAAQAMIEKYSDYTVPRVDKLLDLVYASTVKEYCELVKVGTIQGNC